MAGPRESALRHCGWLTAVTLGVFGVAVWPVFHWSGRAGIEEMSLAAGLCLFPGWLAFWLVSRYVAAKSRALAVLAGSLLRMFLVLGGVLVLRTVWGELPKSFLIWLCVFYLLSLVVETVLVTRTLLPAGPRSSP